MAKKRYYTYGYTPDGKRVSMYIQDGQTYLSDGTRLPSGYTVQTKGGIYKMGDGGGYLVDSHNRPQAPSLDLNEFKNLFTFQSNKDYAQLGKNMYKPIYDSKLTAIRNRLNLDTQALKSQEPILNRLYDQQIEAQQRATEQAKHNYSNETLNRGLGRSTIATTGLTQMDMIGNEQIQSINTDRNISLQNIYNRIQALTENANQEIYDLESNRALEEQRLAYELEDRDRQHWLQEVQVNSPIFVKALQRNWDIADRNYNLDLEQYNYDMSLDRALRQYRPGTQEYELSLKEFERDLDRQYQEALNKFNTQIELDLQRYTPGTSAYKLAQAQLQEQRENVKWEMDLEYQYWKKRATIETSLNNAYKSERSPSFTDTDYGYYNNAKTILNSIHNSKLSITDKLSQLSQIENEIKNDFVYNNTTNPIIRQEIQKLIDAEKEYLQQQLLNGKRRQQQYINEQYINEGDKSGSNSSFWDKVMDWFQVTPRPTSGSRR